MTTPRCTRPRKRWGLRGRPLTPRPESVLPVSPADAASRFYYGWVMLGLATIGMIATSPGQTFGVSVFNEPLRADLQLSGIELATAYMLGTLLAAIPITWVGSLMDRFGLRVMMIAAILAFGGACLVTSQATGWWSLLAAFFLLRMLGPGTLAFVSGNTLSFWFQRQLGMTEGIRNLGMAGAIAVVPALNLWLVQQFGWRGAYTTLGLLVWAIPLPLVLLFFRNRPEEVGQSLDNLTVSAESPVAVEPEHANFTLNEALWTRSFWIVMSGMSLFGMQMTAVFFSLVPIFLDRGLTELDSVQMVSSFGVSLALMHLLGGALADRLPTNVLLAIGIAALSTSMATLRLMSEPWMGHAAGVAMGFAQGIYFGASQPLWARYFGRLHLGKIRGVQMTTMVAASSLGPIFTGAAHDMFGNHNLVLTAFALLPAPLILLSLFATPPKKAPPAAAD